MVSPFETRAVGFLDVLGFSQLVKNAERSQTDLQSLIELKSTLDEHVQFDNLSLDKSVPPAVAPKYIFISDSIILSAPLAYENFDGLAIVVLKTIRIAQKLMETGRLVRGGIAVGNVWHEDTNIFGTGYIEAYKTETSANHPRVLLAPSAAAEWNKTGRFAKELCIDEGDGLAVDLLYAPYVREAKRHGGIEDFFRRVRGHIHNNLETMSLGFPPRSKWEWMAEFFNAAIKRHGVGVEPL